MATVTTLLRRVVFPRAYLIPSAPSPPPPCTQPGSSMDFDLAEKIDRKRRRALRTPDDDMSLTQGYLRDACSPDGCYQVIPHGQVAVKLSGSAWN